MGYSDSPPREGGGWGWVGGGSEHPIIVLSGRQPAGTVCMLWTLNYENVQTSSADPISMADPATIIIRANTFGASLSASS